MKKIIYIIPGLGETSRRKPYQSLANAARKNGYEVIFKNVNWKRPLSAQVFSVPKDAVVFGFSLGAVLAWLVAQKYTFHHVILASMTPLNTFKTSAKYHKALVELLGAGVVKDVAKNLKMKNLAKKQTRIYGELELDGEKWDVLVPKTGHELNTRYIKEVTKLL